jgi:threonine dehydratase
VIPGPLDILAARRRIAGHVLMTPLRESDWLSAAARTRVALKLENVQRSGSFKIRGAFNALARLPRGTRLVTASAGNHGRAIALAAETLGLHATVFTPRDAPAAKVDAIRRHGAELRNNAPDYDAAEAAAQAFARESARPFISPYNHPDVIAGAGTVGLELFDVLADVATIVVPVGGAGLIAGIAIAARAIAPGVRVVGVEVEASHAFLTSLRNGRITRIDPRPTLADGLGGNMDADTMTFEIVQRCVDEIVTVTEDELARGLRGLVGEEHLVAEGAGAAAAAAVLAGKVASPGPLAAIVSGANIDLNRLTRVLGERPDH